MPSPRSAHPQEALTPRQREMCAGDRVKAWSDLMIEGKQPAVASCDHPTEKVAAFGRKLNIRGTPTMFFADGSRVPGYMPVAMLEKALDKGSANIR